MSLCLSAGCSWLQLVDANNGSSYARKLKHTGSIRVMVERLIRDVCGKSTDQDRPRKTKPKKDESPKWAMTHGLPASLCPSNLKNEVAKAAHDVHESVGRDWHDDFLHVGELQKQFSDHLEELFRILVTELASSEKRKTTTIKEMMKVVDILGVGECWVKEGVQRSRHWRGRFTWSLGGSVGTLVACSLQSLMHQVANHLLYSLVDVPLMEEGQRVELVQVWLAVS